MSNKTYGQICPIARSLDVLGDRWTLLLVRELLLGPKRFKDLLGVLPAMGGNRLSDRLSTLVDNGIARQVPLTDASTIHAYELTAFGERLRRPVLSLGFWGLDLPVDARIDPSTTRAELVALCLTGAGPFPEAAGVHAVFEFRVGAEVFHLRVADGALTVRSGPGGDDVDIVASCDTATFLALALHEITTAQALGDGRVTLLHGDAGAFARVFEVLEYEI